MLPDVFKKKTHQKLVTPEGSPTGSDEASCNAAPLTIAGRTALTRQGGMSTTALDALYHKNPSFVDHLPWVECLDEAQCLLLDDGVSVGAVYRIMPVATEGRSEARLEEIRDQLEDALQDSIEEPDTHPWVVQFFCQDEDNIDETLTTLGGYIRPHARGTPYTDAWLKETARHLRGIARAEGLFTDTLVTGEPWRGQSRTTRMVVYRWQPPGVKGIEGGLTELNALCERLVSSLSSAGVNCQRQSGGQVHGWLLRHFNPAPDWVDKAVLYQGARYQGRNEETPGNLPVSNDFAESLLFASPRSEVTTGCWYFDNLPHRAITVERLRKAPEPGALTGERHRGDNINALMDLLPAGTVISLTIVAQAQDTLETTFDKLAKNAVGENTESLRVREDVKTVKQLMGRRHKLYRGNLTFLLRADNEEDLASRLRDCSSVLLNASLQPVRPEYDVMALNNYLNALPMCFDPMRDKKHWSTQISWVQHLAGLLPVTGRGTGTGNPGLSFFNRGGEVLTFDPMSRQDRTQNAHLLLFGPTGAGKSATLCAMLAQLMAVHRPRLFIAEAGNSFGLLADYFQAHGLSVHKVSIKPGSGVTLPLFADARQLIKDPTTLISADNLTELDEDTETEQRDILGEMEISARLMITGGDAKEDAELRRADRAMIREALLMAAKTTCNAKRQMRPEDLKDALHAIANDDEANRNAERRAKAAEMAESLSLFTQTGSFEASLFNQEGELWPQADVTLIDLGHFAREGYEAQMALTMVSLTNTINNIAERDQYLGRDINFVVDEAHIVTVNPLLSPFMTKVVKMWRKLGAWLWLATQNLEDFPDAAGKMLNMAEWWLCLNMPKKEVDEVAKFKTLSEEQKNVLLSTRKLSGCYTEGVVLSKKIEALFRVVPPSLYLALGMTEKDEKAARKALMDKHHISELEAAMMVAASLDEVRGLQAG